MPVQMHKSVISCPHAIALTQIPLPHVLQKRVVGSGLSVIMGLPMSQSWGRQEHPRETGATLTLSTGHASSSFILQPLPMGKEPPAKIWQKPDRSCNIPNFSSYRQKSTSVHTFDVLVIFNFNFNNIHCFRPVSACHGV